MAAPTRAPRTRASGGRTLMLLGVLLALAAGTLVIFIVSQATSSAVQTVKVVVAAQDLQPGTILSVTQDDPKTQHMLISKAVVVKTVASDFVPANAFIFTSQDDLNVKLNNQVVVGTIYNGDILRQSDPRLIALGTGAVGSLTNVNPGELKPGMILGQFKTEGKPLAVPGDYIDILVTECNLPGSKDQNVQSGSGGCETQTTLQNLYVYSVTPDALVLVVTRQQALTLKYLTETGKVQFVIRRPGDASSYNTDPVDGSYIAKSFNY